MKFFNTAGPVNKSIHYKIDPLKRLDTEEILMLIEQQKYFILHAPRQTGKTSCLLALRDYLNKGSDYYCVYANFEAGQAARNDIHDGISSILSELHARISDTLNIKIPFTVNEIIESNSANNALNAYLNNICKLLDKPFILFIDEIDALVGDTLISVLRQLRSGYDTRPTLFPQSVILCGVRDIKDYRIHRSDDDIITGGSCFNIKSESLSLGNFSEQDVRTLYAEHTKETGQQFDDACFPLIMQYTGGQPWLVNALGYEVTFKMKENRDRSVVITADMLNQAKENLILSRATHLDQLADKLKEDRVRHVIEPMLTGDDSDASFDDNEYCVDLGLIKKSDRGYIISNDIYKEVMPRELTTMIQNGFMAKFQPEWINPDATLNVHKLMTMFQQFWRENSDIWSAKIAGYNEAAPHLVFQGFLQWVSNGQGLIEREYGLGRSRADLYLRWKYTKGEQRIVFELKMRTERDNSSKKFEKIKNDGLRQISQYADLCGADEAHLIIFDRRPSIDWKNKLYIDNTKQNKLNISIWGM